MTEILTESFCERCGTRYTFESAKPRTRLKGVKVLSRGLKNFVLSDDTSIDEAMAAARSEADRDASSHQLDAFHKTFNFCMSCRQYTCPNCWNEAEARCLSCAPLAIPEAGLPVHDLPELRDSVLIAETAPSNGAPAMDLAAEAWPAAAEPDDAEAAPSFDDQSGTAAHWVTAAPGAEETVEELAEAPAAIDEPVGVEEEILPASADYLGDEALATDETGDPADKAASQTLGLLQRFRPGQSLDAELDAYERERTEPALVEPGISSGAPMDDLGALQTERLAAALAPAEAEAITAEEPELEMPVADPPIEPEPVLAAEEPAAPPLAATSASDVVEQPTWRITAPDPITAPPAVPGIDEPRAVPPQPVTPAQPAGGEPQWPARPEWPSASAAAGLPFLGRPAAPQGGIDALWAASNQELVATPAAPGKPASGIQPCISCGLSLSATARFCRRCGTLQAR